MKLYRKVALMVETALAIAADDSHGYSQIHRKGNPDFDCSSFVGYCMKVAGFDAGLDQTTKTLGKCLEDNGFTRISFNPEISLQRGDIVLNPEHHVAIMTDDCHLVHASISEKGTIDGQPGDQTGREICTRSFYIPQSGWSFVYRWTNYGMDVEDDVFSFLPILKIGSRGEHVRIIQAVLAYKTGDLLLEIDGIYGSETEKKVRKWQEAHHLDIDGVIGKYTYQSIFTAGSSI